MLCMEINIHIEVVMFSSNKVKFRYGLCLSLMRVEIAKVLLNKLLFVKAVTFNMRK